MRRIQRHWLALFMLTSFSLVTCAKGRQEAVCGDGFCSATEDPLNCPVDCTSDAVCGNGTCEPGETADTCFEDCNPAILCGNGSIDVGEHCDGNNLDDMTCASLNAGTGTLMCDVACRFDLSGCSGSCVDQCSFQVFSRCNGNSIEQCQEGPSGCYVWVETGDCTNSSKVCDDSGDAATCVDTCANACTTGTTRCLGNIVQSCQTGANGCLQWTDANDCSANGLVCSNDGGTALCDAPCTDACDTALDTMCMGDVVYECRQGTGGCLEWLEETDCTTEGRYCSDGACLCSNACTTGDSQCNGNIIQSCTQNSFGCYTYTDGLDCTTQGQICNESSGVASCVDTCTNACSSGETRCSGTLIQSCTLLSTGCYGWQNGTDCATQSKLCVSGSCQCDNQCSSGERTCTALYWAYTCVQDANGCWDWGNEEFCMSSGEVCLFGYCVAP